MSKSRVILFTVAAAMLARPALAQEKPAPAPEEHQHAPTPAPEQDHSAHMAQPGQFPAREGSGTAWLPEATPMYALHLQAGDWELMGHGNVFAQYLYEAAAGDRGSGQGGSINWVMGMARRSLAGGRVGLRTMFSFEPVSIPGCGYPDVLATGEQCDGAPIHDRQHPHDFFMELAAEFERPITTALRWHFYGAVAGEPALGPVAYPHRLSAMPNPLAPISHHWLDATHITFGVVTGGISGRRWKAEASVFNGREPDEHRWDFDLARFDSLSGRVSFAPTRSAVFQVSAGRLAEAEPGHAGGPRVDVARVTGSLAYHRQFRTDSIWATTVAWGRNEEEGEGTQSMLFETSLTMDERDTWFGRVEIGDKAAHDLDIHDVDEVFTVGKLQGGYTRYLREWRGMRPGVGASVSAGIVPRSLEGAYGSRVNGGFGVFLTVRPAAMRMTAPAPAPPAAPPPGPPPPAARESKTGAETASPARGSADPRLPVLPAERVIEPACRETIDVLSAPRTTYQGRVYYFCSMASRDAFLENPAAYAKKWGQ